MTAVRADGRDLPFADGEFELGFSNAVIEHVAGGRGGQQQFIGELCRVAERVFVTTPNRWFPLDPHTLLPFAHWLPAGRIPRAALSRARVRRRARPARARGSRRAVSVSGEDLQPGHDARRDGAAVNADAVRRPVWILHVFVVGLAVHNFAMAELYAAGVRGTALDVVSAWKEALLALGLVLVLRAHGLRRFSPTTVDWLALAYGGLVVLYALIPQHWLGGGATHKGVLYGLRHDLLPVAAYFFGRGLDLTVRDARVLGADGARDRGAGRRLRARRHLPDPALVVARLGGAGLVLAAARLRLPGALRPAGELPLQHRQRASAAPARLDVPLAARKLVHVRRRRCCSRPRGGCG